MMLRAEVFDQTFSCCRLRINGQVQGVGFRPFIYRLALHYQLSGWVRNDGAGVEVLVQGAPESLQAFIAAIPQQLPPHAMIDCFEVLPEVLQPELSGFEITLTQAGAVSTLITPDSAICDLCLQELFDPLNRRYRHAFINCMHCGPRYTLVAALPYDRKNTSMAAFAMCPSCVDEYQDPLVRRFHAQPNACPDCGPQLRFYAAAPSLELSSDPLLAAVEVIRAGKVLALKGLGGFHLVCDARHPVVGRLRHDKLRGNKPFAVMVLNTASADYWGVCTEQHASLLQASERPIVLLDKRVVCDQQLPDIAPGLNELGLFLPYTPLQYLLFYELLGRPQTQDWLIQANPLALVMTSANLAGDALVIDDAELAPLLGNLVDAVLSHNRAILQRCDDSVCRPQQMIRRARGYVPNPIALSRTSAPVLALGAGLKNTICITRKQQAFLSQHIGDLDQATTRAMLQASTSHLMSLLQLQPALVVADYHPDYYSSQFAAQFAAQNQLPLLQVLHHHAHIAAVCAEWQLEGEVLGLALDGLGLGEHGQLWGGELLHVDGLACVHLGGLKPLPLPGGDKAAKQAWRMAVAVLDLLGRRQDAASRFASQPGCDMVLTMLQRQLNCPLTSSMGRYFDAAAALLGICIQQDFEGQAAMLLQAQAERYGSVQPLLDVFLISDSGELDLLPLLNYLADCQVPAYGAALFQATLAQALAQWVQQAVQRRGLQRVVLSGGCFLNRLLLQQLSPLLLAAGLEVYYPQRVPPNDGGIALGQAWLGQLYLSLE